MLSSVIDIPNDNPAIWRLLAEVIPFAVIVGFTIFFIVIEKGDVTIPITENFGKGFVTGTTVGAV